MAHFLISSYQLRVNFRQPIFSINENVGKITKRLKTHFCFKKNKIKT